MASPLQALVRCAAATLLFDIQQSSAMNYRGDGHDLILDLINDAIAINELLTNIFITYFWHNPTREWKPSQIPCCLENRFHNCCGVRGGIRRDVLSDSFKIFNRP